MCSASSAPMGSREGQPQHAAGGHHIDIVAADGGALGKMLPIFRTGFGDWFGQQWMSWIARADLCALIAAALTDSSLQTQPQA